MILVRRYRNRAYQVARRRLMRVGVWAAVLGLLVAVLTLGSTSRAAACSVEIPPPLAQVVHDADAVFVGSVLEVADHYVDGRRGHGNRLEVRAVYAGTAHAQELAISSPDSGCGGGPISGGERLFVVERDHDGVRLMSYVGSGLRAQDLADLETQTGPPRAPLPGVSPAVAEFDDSLARRTWTTRMAAMTIGLLLGTELGWRIVLRRANRHDMGAVELTR